jgi:hypothetical protein
VGNLLEGKLISSASKVIGNFEMLKLERSQRRLNQEPPLFYQDDRFRERAICIMAFMKSVFAKHNGPVTSILVRAKGRFKNVSLNT